MQVLAAGARSGVAALLWCSIGAIGAGAAYVRRVRVSASAYRPLLSPTHWGRTRVPLVAANFAHLPRKEVIG